MQPSRLLVVALSLLVLTSVVTPFAATPVRGATTTSLGFGDDSYTDEAGDVVVFDLSVPNGSTTTLAVGGPAYDARVTVVDVDNDGGVAVHLNTFLAGWQSAELTAYEARGADRVAHVVRTSSRRTAPLAPGPYALELRGPVTDRATLHLGAGAFEAVTPFTAPRDARPGGPSDLRNLSTPSRTVAAGDWAVVSFQASGLGGVARFDDPPVANLVYAVDSTPGAFSTHVVRRPVTTTHAPSRITVDYDAGDGGVPRGLERISRATLSVGYDTDSDGRADVDVTDAVSGLSISTPGVLSLALADAPAATAGHTLVVTLPVENPDSGESDRVAVSIDGHRTTGVVDYGLTGSGTLGNGVDLTLAPVDADGADGAGGHPPSLTASRVLFDAERDVVALVVDTGALDERTYAATLSLTSANPVVSTTRTLTTTFSVVERRVAIDRPAPSFGVTDADIPVVVTTTLSPGTDLTLHVRSPSVPSVLQVYVLTVEADRTAAVAVTLNPRFVGHRVQFVVRENGETVAGPHVGHPAP